MNLIDGKAIAGRINEETGRKVALMKKHGITPGLAVVLVGEDPPSVAYVRNKDRISQQLGLYSRRIELDQSTTQKELLAVVDRLNADPDVHGILVQSPPPPQIDESEIVKALNPAKDVDGLHPLNVAKLAMGDPTALVPCTPLGCQKLLVESGITIEGKHAVILGRSMLVGKSLALLLMRKGQHGDATVTVAHSRSLNLTKILLSADIIISAIGKAGYLRGEQVREGAVVLDVGTSRVEDPSSRSGYRLAGDVAFDEVAAKAQAITPVPGGVGPMTIAMLMVNTVAACQNQTGFSV